MSPPTSTFLYLAAVVLGLTTSLGDASRLFNDSNMHHSGINATNFFKNPAEVLAVPLRRVDHQGVATPSIAKRFFKTDVLGVYGAAYMAELTIGTGRNEQIVDVLIDTGSFELWVNPDCAASNVPDFCDAFGHYDPALSPSAENLNGDFDIQYGSGSASGTYYKDDMYISGARVQDQQFGVANRSDLVWFGIMGLGYGQGNGFINYPLVIDSLAAQGFTNSKLFSLDLGRQVDPSVIDSGTTLSLLPESLVSKLAAQFPGATPDGKGGYKVPCTLQAEDGDRGSVDFEFLSPGIGGPVTISVSYRDFIWNSGSDCFLGAVHADDIGVWILGDTFLRGAYVSFDQTNNALYMSNYRTCGTGPNLVPVPAGPDAAAKIQGSCPPPPIVVGLDPPSISSVTLPDGAVSSTAVASAASDVARVGDAEEDPTSTTTTTTTPRVTLTSTLTRAIAYTVSSCTGSEPGCAELGRVATKFETTVTTFCPGYDDDENTGRPSAATSTAGIVALGVGMIPESSAPVASMLMPTNTVVSLQQDQGPGQGLVALPQALVEAEQEEGQEEGQEEEEEAQTLTTTVITSRCSTSTYAVSTCDPGVPACTLDATTTRVITIVETILQLVKPTPASTRGSSAIVAYNTPRPPLSPQRMTPGAALSFGPVYNSSDMGVAGFGGVKQSAACATCRGATIAPGSYVNTNTNRKGKGMGPTPTSTSEAGVNTSKPFSSGAAPVDHGLADRVYLFLSSEAVFGFVALL
ncbi:aspartic peptidase domain-containing protein [Biscogniauxia marginata]|nr:aspartic peptidase domain-containing protein [Biscogniauxia marginata]